MCLLIAGRLPHPPPSRTQSTASFEEMLDVVKPITCHHDTAPTHTLSITNITTLNKQLGLSLWTIVSDKK